MQCSSQTYLFKSIGSVLLYQCLILVSYLGNDQIFIWRSFLKHDSSLHICTVLLILFMRRKVTQSCSCPGSFRVTWVLIQHMQWLKVTIFTYMSVGTFWIANTNTRVFRSTSFSRKNLHLDVNGLWCHFVRPQAFSVLALLIFWTH